MFNLWLKNYKQSILDFNKSIEINPYNSEAYFKRGLSKNKLKMKDSACKDFRKAAELGYPTANDAIKYNCK